jgi:alkylation response protein AidB-like acyl-CoA dehydrogenase
MLRPFESESFQSLLGELAASLCPEATEYWPEERLNALRDAGVLKWNMPVEFGGLGLDGAKILEGYQQLAASCLVTTFIMTQRNGACQRIMTSPYSAPRERLLPLLVSGEIFATVGISHLTTSGQHLQTPAVSAKADGAGYVLNGFVPWATGATQADILVTGGQLEDGRQLLAALPTKRQGVLVNPPVELMALGSSQTGSVKLTNVHVQADEILHGPVEAVMQQGSGGGAGSLGTSVLAAGATEGMLSHLQVEAERRPDLKEFCELLQLAVEDLVEQIRLASSGQHPAGTAASEQIRQIANSLVLRTAQSWLAATKGAGYVVGHRAERAVRESMFFLVWSCPQPVLSANLRELACGGVA